MVDIVDTCLVIIMRKIITAFGLMSIHVMMSNITTKNDLILVDGCGSEDDYE